ncbi:Homeodomain-like protein [Lasiosphaeris hirsuta]|uniref:Homeodomain-like protein n=1 Tax=Lasiosphaeris hirsuta TaxID=260670 RepID=A0AA40B1N3_9PEZI|nr:Homeodomain-like protein [Lasiosphaeris hirsuta]
MLQDPPCYGTTDTASSPSPSPLFGLTAESETEQLVNEHIASRPVEQFRGATPPKREDYELALYFKSNCFNMFQADRRGYFRRERELIRSDRKHIALARPMTKLATILPASRPSAPKPVVKTSVNRVQKPKSPKIKAQVPRPIRATPTTARSTIRVSATPEPRVRTVAPNREDKDFASLRDYCPPLNSLPNKPNSLKVDWKGNALDLSKDPHAHLLHPDEILLAAGLRLDCATYLTSKRRIFIRRLECANIGKEFRKTDAQQACKIDVNKASKLWTAYDKVGWLDIKWMGQFLGNSV